jgi:hypothetical protein
MTPLQPAAKSSTKESGAVLNSPIHGFLSSHACEVTAPTRALSDLVRRRRYCPCFASLHHFAEGSAPFPRRFREVWALDRLGSRRYLGCCGAESWATRLHLGFVGRWGPSRLWLWGTGRDTERTVPGGSRQRRNLGSRRQPSSGRNDGCSRRVGIFGWVPSGGPWA